MKLFRIVRRDGAWQALGGDSEHVIAVDTDRDALIALACKMATRHRAELYVFDESGKLEVVYVYTTGNELLVYPYRRRPHLQLVPGKTR